MRNKNPGELHDPRFGIVRCVPVDWDEEWDPDRRDGADIVISFVEAPEFDESQDTTEIPTIEGLNSAAGFMDGEIERVDWQQELPPERTVNPLQAIGGVAAQVQDGANRNLNALEKFIAQTEDVEKQVDALEDPNTFSLKRRSRRARDQAHRTRQRLGDPQGRLVRVTTTYAQSLSEVAANMHVSLSELLRVNTDLIGLTEVPAGTEIRAPRRAA
jgi:hypothetical protein